MCPAWQVVTVLSDSMDPSHRGSRRVYRSAIPLDLCQELLFIQRSLAVVGYRPHVQSLTLYEMILACPQLLPVVAKARQLIWDLVEVQFDSPCSVWPETTSLISWTAGASIGWHHDANRPYLAARHFSAVAYLNTQGHDFEGGTFCFQSGSEPLQVQPSAGMLLIYTADDSNVHSVQEVIAGERSALTMWFTLDPEHQEDRKVLSKLQSCPSAGLPSTMYLLGDGLDIRVARLQQRLGLTIRPAPCGAQQQQLLEPQTAAEQLADVQEHVVVQCCAHPAHVCSGSSFVFSGLHTAVMACCMLEWMGASTPLVPTCSQRGGHGPHPPASTIHSAAVNVGTNACSTCALLARVAEADARVQHHLEQASQCFEHLLPTWHQLEALIPPA